ncbi:hypothetical protein [Hymenobacter volaticus]|uniref:Uncharacterized protein n=1 Tax=Hymenobacter volaticus TaxID=2932254 RepID=A0ABY4GHI9_9BACT|nr:hypothetical protein [Hymenobacter volaticus]UOQ69889.1 hypothetical protein MUN86_30775 [Hymenobacter volaticus]
MRLALLLLLLPFISCQRMPAFNQQAGQPLKPVFNVPLLLTKNIEQVAALLPTARQEELLLPTVVLNNGHTMRERSFRQDTLQLVVTYSQQSRQVYHVYLTTQHQKVGDYLRLLQLGNLEKAPNRLDMEPQALEGRVLALKGVFVRTKR